MRLSTGPDYHERTFGVEPDTIPDLTGDQMGPLCEERHPVACVCTRLPNHTGRHAAGNGDHVVAVWCSNTECDGGWVQDLTACGDPDHCDQIVPCGLCNPKGLRP